MPDSLNAHQPMLINTVGHGVGLLAFGWLLALLLRDRFASLPALAAGLAFVWNAAALVSLSGAPGASASAAVGFAALSLLPAVLLSIALGPAAPWIRRAGWLAGGCAAALHLAEPAFHPSRLHETALLLITVAFVALTIGAAFVAARVVAAMALLLFAGSFVHLAEPGAHAWSQEIALHHAGIPIALLIVLQDYRVLFADVFVRLLGTGALAAAMTAAALLLAQRMDLTGTFERGTLVVCALAALLLFAAWNAALQRWITRRVLNRAGLDETLRELSRVEGDVQRIASGAIARHVGAERCEIGDGEKPDWAVLAVPVIGETRIFLGRRRGGWRYLSEDLAELSQLATGVMAALERSRTTEARRVAAEAELRALQAQINPHFLFNALNALYGIIPRGAEAARRTVLNLSDLFRYFLQTDRALIPLAEEVRIIRAYLDIEQLRLGDRLRVEILVEEETLGIEVPALSIEPIVENAVKHGIAPMRGAGVVSLRVRRTDGGVEAVVADTGGGFDPSTATGVGLASVRQRLWLMYGERGSVDVQSDARGTTVTLRIPDRRALACAS